MDSSPTHLEPPPLPQPAEPLDPRWLTAALGLTAVADFLLWPAQPGGLAVACLIVVLALAFYGSAIFRFRRLLVLLALALASAAQAVVELKTSTVVVSGVLLLGLVGEGHWSGLGSSLARWIEATLALFLPFDPLRRLVKAAKVRAQSVSHSERRQTLWRLVQVVLPALALAAVFSMFFAGGNEVFRQVFSRVCTSLMDWILSLDFSLGRLLFWACAFVLLLSLLRPRRTGWGERLAACQVPLWQRRDEALARWQSIAVLVVLNALFFSVNSIDVIYLWARSALPADVNPSAFLHEGVQSLIFAVLLSAAVLVLLFQQKIAQGSRLLRWLATVWVTQNLLVLAGVFLRLKLYVDELQLTLLRLGVGLFLLLVIAGFVLLTIYFWRGKGFGWLFQANVASTFLLFFLVQFIDLPETVAQYNTGRWLRGASSHVDVEYLGRLGHGAWLSLIQIAERDRHQGPARVLLNDASWLVQAELDQGQWRRWELLRSRRGRAVLAYLAAHPSPS